MEIEIENYRGFEIRFNKDYETFVCDIYDKGSIKKSYSSIKKFIDEFIKENNVFSSIKVRKSPNSSYVKDGIINIIGVRKDGRFISEINGVKGQISNYDEKDYILYDKDEDIYFEQLKKENEDFENLRLIHLNNRKEIISKIKSITLSQYRKNNF